MAAKPQRSLRFEQEAYDGIIRLKQPNETFTATVNRLLLVGIDKVEGEIQAKREARQGVAQEGHDETQTTHDEGAARYVELLEAENARLIAEHEKDLERIARKDEQIAEALSRAHDLAAQSNHIAMLAHDVGRIPASTTAQEITVVTTDENDDTEDDTKGETQESAEPAKEEKRGWFSRMFW